MHGLVWTKPNQFLVFIWRFYNVHIMPCARCLSTPYTHIDVVLMYCTYIYGKTSSVSHLPIFISIFGYFLSKENSFLNDFHCSLLNVVSCSGCQMVACAILLRWCLCINLSGKPVEMEGNLTAHIYLEKGMEQGLFHWAGPVLWSM